MGFFRVNVWSRDFFWVVLEALGSFWILIFTVIRSSPSLETWACDFPRCQESRKRVWSPTGLHGPKRARALFPFGFPSAPTLGARGLSCAVSGLGRQVTKRAARNLWHPGYSAPVYDILSLLPAFLLRHSIDLLKRDCWQSESNIGLLSECKRQLQPEPITTET